MHRLSRQNLRRLAIPIQLAVLVGVCWHPAARSDDQERARKAVETGEIRPLDQVLRVVQERVPGEVVKVELERDDGRWIYEIKILTASGKRREVEIDARSLQILEIE